MGTKLHTHAARIGPVAASLIPRPPEFRALVRIEPGVSWFVGLEQPAAEGMNRAYIDADHAIAALLRHGLTGIQGGIGQHRGKSNTGSVLWRYQQAAFTDPSVASQVGR